MILLLKFWVYLLLIAGMLPVFFTEGTFSSKDNVAVVVRNLDEQDAEGPVLLEETKVYNAEHKIHDDVDPNGPCKKAVQSGICKITSPAAGALAHCLRRKFILQGGPADDGGAPQVPLACFHAANTFLQAPTSHPSDMMPEWAACEEDAARLRCFPPDPRAAAAARPGHGNAGAPPEPVEDATERGGGVEGKEEGGGGGGGGGGAAAAGAAAEGLRRLLPCLRGDLDGLTDRCREVVLEELRAQALDWRSDAALEGACRGVPVAEACAEEGRVPLDGGEQEPFFEHGPIDCLIGWHLALPPRCWAEVFKRQEERGRDARLSPGLWGACRAELEGPAAPCADEPYGNGRKIRCLWENRHHIAMSTHCRNQVHNQIVTQEKDYRWDARLHSFCSDDIHKLCGKEKARQEKSLDLSSEVQVCLKQNFDDVTHESCKEELERVVSIQHELWDADLHLKNACKADVGRHCGGQTEEHINSCLRENLGRISALCKEAIILDLEVEEHDIVMKTDLMESCKDAIQTWCPDIQEGDGELIECLELHRGRPGAGVGAPCRAALAAEARAEARDGWRLGPGGALLARACAPDANRLCKNEMKHKDSGNRVSACLEEKKANITDWGCREAVQRHSALLAAAPTEEEGGGAAAAAAAAAAGGVRMEEAKIDKKIMSHCGNGVRQFCPSTQEPHAISSCLNQHYQALSSSCRSALAAEGFSVYDSKEGLFSWRRADNGGVNDLTILRKACKGTCVEGDGLQIIAEDLINCLVLSPQLSPECSSVLFEKFINVQHVDEIFLLEVSKECGGTYKSFIDRRVCIKDPLSSQISHPNEDSVNKLSENSLACLVKHQHIVRRPQCQKTIHKLLRHRVAAFPATPAATVRACGHEMGMAVPRANGAQFNYSCGLRCALNNYASIQSPECKARVDELFEQQLASTDLNLELVSTCGAYIQGSCHNSLSLELESTLKCLEALNLKADGTVEYSLQDTASLCAAEMEQIQILKAKRNENIHYENAKREKKKGMQFPATYSANKNGYSFYNNSVGQLSLKGWPALGGILSLGVLLFVICLWARKEMLMCSNRRLRHNVLLQSSQVHSRSSTTGFNHHHNTNTKRDQKNDEDFHSILDSGFGPRGQLKARTVGSGVTQNVVHSYDDDDNI